MNWMEQLLQTVTGTDLFILTPDPKVVSTLAGPIDGLSREDGIVMQRQVDNNVSPAAATLDGGDSANRTGVLAFGGSSDDANLLDRFSSGGLMWRHPTDKSATHDHTNPNNCSRDQLIGFAAGCWRAGRSDIVEALLRRHEERGWLCQNSEKDLHGGDSTVLPDILFPQDQMFLRVCAGRQGAHLDLLGQAMLQVTIEAIAVQDSTTEINQHLLQSIVCGRLDHFVEYVPDYQRRLNEYWGGWRDQPQIAALLGAVVEIELKRYETFPGLYFPPLPVHIIKAAVDAMKTIVDAATHINWWLDAGNVMNAVPSTAQKLFVAALEDGKRSIEYQLKVGLVMLATAKSMAMGLVENISTGVPVLAVANVLMGRFGTTGDQWHESIDNRLRDIEAKLQDLIAFITVELPALVYQQTKQAVIEQKVNDIIGAKTHVDAMLASYRRSRSSSNKQNLLQAANDIADRGISVAQNGPAWECAVSLAFRGFSSAYLHLVVWDESLRGAMCVYAKKYRDIAAGWMKSDGTNNIASSRDELDRTLADARTVVGPQPLGNFLLAIYDGPIQAGQVGYTGGDPNVFPPSKGWPTWETYWVMKAWIDPKKVGQWEGDWGDRYSINVAPGTKVTPAIVMKELNVTWKELGFMGTLTPPQTHEKMNERFNIALQRINEAQRNVDTIPAKLAILEAAGASASAITDACDHLLMLKPAGV